MMCYNNKNVLFAGGVCVAVSEAQKKSRDKWDKANMITLGCKVKKEQAEKFKEYAKKMGVTSNTLLKEFVLKCIDEDFS